MADSKPSTVDLSATTEADAASAVARPSAEPPTSGGGGAYGGAAGAVGATVWVNNKTVNSLRSINENRNSWVGVAGVGWLRLANNSDSAVVALTALCSSARQTQTPVNYRTEADGMVHEIYVW